MREDETGRDECARVSINRSGAFDGELQLPGQSPGFGSILRVPPERLSKKRSLVSLLEELLPKMRMFNRYVR